MATRGSDQGCPLIQIFGTLYPDYMVKYSPSPEGPPEGKGLYLTVFSKSSPYTDSI